MVAVAARRCERRNLHSAGAGAEEISDHHGGDDRLLAAHLPARPPARPARPRRGRSRRGLAPLPRRHHRESDDDAEPADRTRAFRRVLAAALAYQAHITRRTLRLAALSPSRLRFRLPGLPLAPLLFDDANATADAAAALQLAGALALLVWPRAGALCSAAAVAYLLLAEQSLYQNHYWLVLNVLLCYAAAARRPRALLSLLRFTTLVPYAFGAYAKLSEDWALRWEPAALWCARDLPRTSPRVLAPLLASPLCAPALSIGGIVIDAAVPLLLALPSAASRWRAVGYAAALGFHVCNALLFHIGIFPAVMAGALVLWPPPRLTGQPEAPEPPAKRGRANGATRRRDRSPARPRRSAPAGPPPPAAFTAFAAAYVALHLALPLRHGVLYPDRPLWTQEGYLFSWHMKLTRISGVALVEISSAADDDPRCALRRPLVLAPQFDASLSPYQSVFVATRPSMLLAYAADAAADAAAHCGGASARVVLSCFSLNGRRPQPLYNASAELLPIAASGAYERPGATGVGSWIVPLAPTGCADGLHAECAALLRNPAEAAPPALAAHPRFREQVEELRRAEAGACS